METVNLGSDIFNVRKPNDDTYHIEIIDPNGKKRNISDGYHTFNELYAQRIALFKLICYLWYLGGGDREPDDVWKAKLHNDGSSFEGWFIAGLFREPGKQITYHIPMSEWDSWPADAFEKAPHAFDGHTSEDVLKRLSDLIK